MTRDLDESRAVLVNLFTVSRDELRRSGTGILPVKTGYHRQDADATDESVGVWDTESGVVRSAQFGGQMRSSLWR